MHFELTDEQRTLRDEVRQFAATELAPNADAWDRSAALPDELYRKLGNTGLMGLSLPTEFGGRGLDQRCATIVIEELARHDGATALMLCAQQVASALLHAVGSESLKQQLLPKLASGEQIAAWISNAAVKASQQDTHWVINGEASLVLYAGSANHFIVVDRDTKHACCIESNAKGVHVHPADDKLGMRACHTATVTFESLSVTAENVLADADAAISVACNHERILLAALAVGLARGSLEEALASAQKPDAVDQLPADHQSIQFMLADMDTTIDAARLLVRRAAWRADNGKSFGTDAATAKLFASETATKAALDAIQICGAAGYTRDLPLERYLRDAKFIELIAGTSQQQRLNIAQAVLAD